MSSLFGYTIDSEVALGRAAPEPGPRGTLRVERGALTGVADGAEVLASFDTCALARGPAGAVVTCALTGTFVIDGETRTVAVDAAACEPADLEHRVVATAVPLLAAELGDVVLHAAAIETDAGVVLFCGPSGRGKSTLAAALATHGHRVLADDGAVVSFEPRAVAWPGPTGIRLWRDGGRALVPARRAPAPVPLAAIVVLAPRGGASAAVERLDPAEAVPEVVPHVMTAASPVLPAAFATAARLAREVPVWRGRLPDDLAALDSDVAGLVAGLRP